MNIRESKQFIALSLASDLQNIAQGVYNRRESQVMAFVHHAKGLSERLKQDERILGLLNNLEIPSSDEARLKLADKIMTWSAILQTTYVGH